MVRYEVYRIAREALVNAVRHARARSIEVELEFEKRRLRLVVRDDGIGIDPAVLQAGREGHWGLSGMRERAQRIGARLDFWSAPQRGTEIELSVPNHLAFEAGRVGAARSWIRRMRSRARGVQSEREPVRAAARSRRGLTIARRAPSPRRARARGGRC